MDQTLQAWATPWFKKTTTLLQFETISTNITQNHYSLHQIDRAFGRDFRDIVCVTSYIIIIITDAHSNRQAIIF